jgi:hypothetical protein
MKSIAALIMLITAVAAQAAESTPIKRHYLGKWEQEIGYAGRVVRSASTPP